MKNKKGFTLVELVIVIIIVGILSIVAVPVYRNYVQRAIDTEAIALMGTIARAEDLYYAEYGCYYIPEGYNTSPANISYDENLNIDCRGNKYFTSFRGGGTKADPCFVVEYNGRIFTMNINRNMRTIRLVNGPTTSNEYERIIYI